MKKFEFRLDRVMDAYRAQEQDILRKFANAMQHLSQEKNRLEDVRNKISSRDEELRKKAREPMAVGNALMDSLYSDKLRQDAKLIRKEVHLREKKVNEVRVELAEAVRRRKVVELLREKKLEEYKLELKRSEQLETDEHTARKFAKRSTIELPTDG